LAGVSIEVLDGPDTGMTGLTDSTGWFTLTGRFDDTTRLRATKEGHSAATVAIGAPCTDCAGPHIRYVGLSLAPLIPPAGIVGNYDLTFVVDSACHALPEELRTRSFRASIVPSADPGGAPGTSFSANLSGATFFDRHDSFPVGVAGNRVVFLTEDDLPYLVEEVAPNTYLAFSGRASVDLSDAPVSTISVSYQGLISYCTPAFQPYAYCNQAAQQGCESKNHRLILTRR
jgi:hypothetical protein